MDQIQAVVNDIDLSHITNRLHDRGGYEQDVALQATDMYRKFLYLKAKYPGMPLVGPRLVDQAWHEHILNTEAYMKDCQKLFGCYMHHNPNPPSKVHSAGWENTKNLFVKEFGIDLTKGTLEGFQVADASV
ncbi:MAG: hypothetical protein INF43_04305 [Alphaproteobacteria bacterium]|jgi:hypothetical protein|nr:hypothetical protein [Alphaproteobacteria bacterium]